MPIDLQTAELTTRIRRGFGQRGILSVSLDEVAVPVVPIYDLDTPPFRTDGLRFFTSAPVAAGGAGLFGYLQLINGAQANVNAVVDQIGIQNIDAAHHTFVVAFDSTVGSVAILDIVPELGVPSPMNPGTGSNAALGGSVCYRFDLAPNTSVIFPTEIMVAPTHNIIVACLDANIAFGASISGRYWIKQA